MEKIYFQIPDIKKSIASQLSINHLKHTHSSANFIEVQQKEIESGLFCTQINVSMDQSLEWTYNAKSDLDYIIFCFWIEIKESVGHLFNIINSNTDFSFKLKKNVLYKGFIFSLSQNWIKRSITSNIMKSYLLQIKNEEIKTLFFNDNEITDLIKNQKKTKWQFNIECWQLMGMVIEKIVLDIQNEKKINVLNKKRALKKSKLIL